MSFILKLLTGTAGPYIAGAIAGLLLLSAGWGEVQTLRLHHAKSDLTTARAALIDPATHKPWKDEAQAAMRDLGTCRTNTLALQSGLNAQNAAVAALKSESDARLAQSRKEVSAARSVAESYRQTAGVILGRKAGADVCASASELIGEVR